MTDRLQPAALGARRAQLRALWQALSEQVTLWLSDPRHRRLLLTRVLPALIVLGLLLPPVQLVTRVRTRGYAVVLPGRTAVVPSAPQGAYLEIRGAQLGRALRIRVRSLDPTSRGVPDLPEGYAGASRVYALSFDGDRRAAAYLDVPFQGPDGQQSLTDAFGWDGERWRWLPTEFGSGNRARIALDLDAFAPGFVALGLAGPAATEVSAVLLEPPASVPAAVAELPVVELRAYHLSDGDGDVRGEAFPVPTRSARRYGVVDNREGNRTRLDLVNNMLAVAASRQRNREAIIERVQRDELAGIVLDYDGIRGDLQRVYTDWLGRLAGDLHRAGAELIVAVPMPLQTGGTWDGRPYQWLALGQIADGLRIRLPEDVPLTLEQLDSLVRWALGYVDRRRLQLALGVRGRDQVESSTSPIAYGDALAHILDMAQSDAPQRIDPGAAATVDLPTIRAAELARDPETGLWRFYYWDANRRRHTVWLFDAAGVQPVFEIASRYRLGRIALDGFSTGVDPSLWRMARTFARDGVAAAESTDYLLAWRLLDASGQLVQEAIQPLEGSTFAFRAPTGEGSYELGVNLITADGRTMVVGQPAPVQVALAPPPTPIRVAQSYKRLPTPEMVVTAPPPADESSSTRSPVLARPTGTEEPIADFDASVAFATGELRSAPDFDAAKLTDLRPGEVMTVFERTADSNWLHVKLLATGLEGWLRQELVDLHRPLHTIPVHQAVLPTATARP